MNDKNIDAGETMGGFDLQKGRGKEMITLRALGGIEIRDAEGTPVTLRSRKHVGLLLVLVGGNSRVYSRSRLCDFFWTSDSRRSRHSLSQAIYDLTKQIGPIVNRGPGEDVSLDRSQVKYDVTEFEEAVNSGDLEAAIELYGGPFAENLVDVGTREFESWVDSERTRLNRLGEIVLRRYVGQCESRGAWGKMCVSALKLAALTPLDEAVHTAFIRALWLNGDPESALRHFEAISGTFDNEGSEGVSTDLRDLVDCIRRQPVVDTMDVRPIDREPPFVGRESAFKRLRDAVTQASSSGASAIVVCGEAGIGKSRLLKEFNRSIRVEQARVLESRCYQAEEDLPYTPIVDALTPVVQEFIKTQPNQRTRYARLSDLFPDLGPSESASGLDSSELATWQRQLYEEVASLLERVTERELVVWTVDDVQWIDRASGALLHYLLRRLSASRFLLVLTTRPSLNAGESPFLDVSGLEAPRAEVISLDPLPLDQMRELVYAAEPLGPEHPAADLAVRLSAGNPYYALEVLEAAAESSEWAQSASDWDPLNDERLRKLLNVRVSGLSATSVRVLQAIAVLERHARPRIVAAVAGISISKTASVAEELYVRGLVVDEGPRVAFTNDVMREYVYGEMNSLRRTALHLKAGQVLELETSPPPGSLATHFYHGDDWPRSFGYAMEAACSAQRASGHSEAAHFAGIAAEVAPGAAEKGAALVTRGDSLFAAGDLTGAAEAYQRVLDSCLPESSAEVATVCIKLAKTQVERCLWGDAKRVLSVCRDAVGKVSSPEQRLLLQSERATLLLKHAVRTDDSESATEAADSIDSALSSLRGLTAPARDTRVAVLTSKAVLLGVEGRSQDALEYMQLAAPHLGVSDSAQAARYFNYRGVVKAWLADWFGAEADFRKARDIAETIGDRVGLTTQWNNLTCVALERGDWAEAEERLSRAEDIHMNLAFSNDASLPIALNRADLLFYQGYTRRAEAAYADAAKMCEEQESTDRRSEAISCLGLIALQRGKMKAALELWELLKRLESPATTGLGTRERFKVAWFARAMASNGTGYNSLVEAADRERQRDLPSYLKLRWLSVIFDDNATADSNEVRGALHAKDMGWFCHVVNRWSRAAQNPSLVTHGR